jgi:MerR family regulatory protein
MLVLKVTLKSRGAGRTVARLPVRVTIGEPSARSGVAASALRFYEAQGLISAERTSGTSAATPATCRGEWRSSEPHNWWG